ncbi:hypothetical protein BDF19DRAFT_198240 [Syncephalis fuscata]|nr:hypothetical protein BDF19DRAFT_198240 [Syncephalis fuscata]
MGNNEDNYLTDKELQSLLKELDECNNNSMDVDGCAEMNKDSMDVSQPLLFKQEITPSNLLLWTTKRNDYLYQQQLSDIQSMVDIIPLNEDITASLTEYLDQLNLSPLNEDNSESENSNLDFITTWDTIPSLLTVTVTNESKHTSTDSTIPSTSMDICSVIPNESITEPIPSTSLSISVTNPLHYPCIDTVKQITPITTPINESPLINPSIELIPSPLTNPSISTNTEITSTTIKRPREPSTLSSVQHLFLNLLSVSRDPRYYERPFTTTTTTTTSIPSSFKRPRINK